MGRRWPKKNIAHAGYTIVCKDIESEEKAGRQEEEDKEI